MSVAIYFKEQIDKIKELREELNKHIRLQLGLETIFQVAGNTLLLFYAKSSTKTRQGLAALFEKDALVIAGTTFSSQVVIGKAMKSSPLLGPF